MELLQLDFTVPLRTFALELALEVGGEPLAIVGPSGAGKSTILRAIAGLVHPARGTVAYGDRVWLDTDRGIDVAPERRSVGLVFQEYALFPHMTVEANIAYGARKPRPDLLERLRIAHLAHARPGDISGGERQRVALARALAREPSVLLLDEPMAALDAHTRGAVRAELDELLREIRLPTLIVTHDFEDAAVLARKVGVLVDGTIRQLATPGELVAEPADAFVAALAGGSLLPGHARTGGDGLTEVTLADGTRIYSTDPLTGQVNVAIYPWDVSLSHGTPDDSALNHIHGEVASVAELGNRVRVRINGVTAEITTASAHRLGVERGTVLTATFKAAATRLLPR